jgi:DNA-binding transcriptional LysR family regulator
MQLGGNIVETHSKQSHRRLDPGGNPMRSSPFRDVSLVQLSYFVAAAEWGSMTAAASELFVAQSAVSTSVANLEQTLGVQLLIRRRAKGLQLTAQGAELLTRARLILATVDDTVLALRPENASGRISVGCFRTLAPFYLPSIIRDLSVAHPELQVDVRELTADEVQPALDAQAIEVAFTYDLGLGSEVNTEVLETVPLYAAVAADHPLASRDEVSLTELAELPMVMLDMPVSRDYFLNAFTENGLRPSVRYRFGNFEAVRAMVALGHGFTLLNQQPKLGYTYQGSELRRLKIIEDVRPLDLVIASLNGTQSLTRKAQLFADQCRATVIARQEAS